MKNLRRHRELQIRIWHKTNASRYVFAKKQILLEVTLNFCIENSSNTTLLDNICKEQANKLEMTMLWVNSKFILSKKFEKIPAKQNFILSNCQSLRQRTEQPNSAGFHDQPSAHLGSSKYCPGRLSGPLVSETTSPIKWTYRPSIDHQFPASPSSMALPFSCRKPPGRPSKLLELLPLPGILAGKVLLFLQLKHVCLAPFTIFLSLHNLQVLPPR